MNSAPQRSKRTIRSTFFRNNSLKKIGADTFIVLVTAFFVYGILPRGVTFFDLASAHTTFLQKAIHTLVGLACIIFFRTILMVYKQSWNNTKTIYYLNIMIADCMAGVLYLVITEYALGSVYPFLLTLCTFAMNDIATLFVRLLYKAISEDMCMTEQ